MLGGRGEQIDVLDPTLPGEVQRSLDQRPAYAGTSPVGFNRGGAEQGRLAIDLEAHDSHQLALPFCHDEV
jgi:hypothetical protein